MFLEGLIDSVYLKSQQMRSGSVSLRKPLHLYDPVPLLLRQQRPMEPSLALILPPASTSLGWDDWSGPVTRCLTLLLNKILLHPFQREIKSNSLLQPPRPCLLLCQPPLSLVHTQTSSLLPTPHHQLLPLNLPRWRCCLAGSSSQREH